MNALKKILGLFLTLFLIVLLLSRLNVIKFGIARFESPKQFQVISKSPITTINHYLIKSNDSLQFPRNKTIFLNFWATMCAPCRKEIPILNKLRECYENENILFLSVCTNANKHNIDSLLKEFDKKYTLKRVELKEGAESSLIKLAATFNKTIDTTFAPLPATFIIKNDSIYYYRNIEIVASDTNYLTKALLQ